MTKNEILKVMHDSRNKPKIGVEKHTGDFDYKMSKKMYEYYKSLKNKSKVKGDLVTFIIDDINDNYELTGTCVGIVVG